MAGRKGRQPRVAAGLIGGVHHFLGIDYRYNLIATTMKRPNRNGGKCVCESGVAVA